MTDQTAEDKTKNNQEPSKEIEAERIIRIRVAKDGSWQKVKLRFRGTLWAHVDDGTRQFRVQWKDVHPNDKFDFQQ